MLRELKEIAAALREMKSSRGVSQCKSGKPEHATDDSDVPLTSRQAAHAEEKTGDVCRSQQDTAREKHLDAAANTRLVKPSHPDSGGNQQATESSKEQSRHRTLLEGNMHGPGQDGQTGQAVAKQAHHKEAVDKGVQATPTAHRVPVQAVLLTPTTPAHQVILATSCTQCFLRRRVGWSQFLSSCLQCTEQCEHA